MNDELDSMVKVGDGVVNGQDPNTAPFLAPVSDISRPFSFSRAAVLNLDFGGSTCDT